MQIYAARNNQRRYCFFYLIPVLICHCFIASKPQSVHVDDSHGKGQWYKTKRFANLLLPIEFLARLENRPRQTGEYVSNNIIDSDQQEQLSNVSAPIDQPGNIPRTAGLFSGSWETNLNTTLRLQNYWSDDDKGWASQTWQKVGELEAVWMFVGSHVAICCLGDRKYESLHREHHQIQLAPEQPRHSLSWQNRQNIRNDWQQTADYSSSPLNTSHSLLAVCWSQECLELKRYHSDDDH